METLYRKVAVSERNPTKSGEYFTNEGTVFYASTYNGFEHNIDPHRVYPDWWLEPIESHQIEKLEADKAELLEALESIKPALRYFPERLNEIESLIQKMKQ